MTCKIKYDNETDLFSIALVTAWITRRIRGILMVVHGYSIHLMLKVFPRLCFYLIVGTSCVSFISSTINQQ